MPDSVSLPEAAAHLLAAAIDDSISSVRAGVVPFAPHLMVMEEPAGPEDRHLRHVRFMGDLGEGLEQARARAQAEVGASAYAIAWDGYLTVDGDRRDAVFVEVGSAAEPEAWLFAQAYGQVKQRFRRASVGPDGAMRLVDRVPSRWTSQP